MEPQKGPLKDQIKCTSQDPTEGAGRILDLLVAGTADGLVKYDKDGTARTIRMRLREDCRTLEYEHHDDEKARKETVDLSSILTFHYGLNTHAIFSKEEKSETFKEISRLSFYMIYSPDASREFSHDGQDGVGSERLTLNLTATSSQAYSVWSSLCALASAWKLCLTQQKEYPASLQSRDAAQDCRKLAAYLPELVRRNAVEDLAALEAIAFLMGARLRHGVAIDEELDQATKYRLCKSLTEIVGNIPAGVTSLINRRGLTQEVPPVLCRLLTCADNGPAVQEGAARALQSLSLRLPTSEVLALHAAVLALLNEAAGRLSTKCIITLLELLASNAPYGGYLTQQSAHFLRMLALVKDDDLAHAASCAVASLPIAGSVVCASEVKFAFLERTLLPLPVLKRSPEVETLDGTVDTVGVDGGESAEKQILVTPHPFDHCRLAARQLFKSNDFEVAPSRSPATLDGPPSASRKEVPANLAGAPAVHELDSEPSAPSDFPPPRPLSPNKSSVPARSPLRATSPSPISRSRDLARAASPRSPATSPTSLSPERRAMSPPGRITRPVIKKALSGLEKDGTSKGCATRSPLRERVKKRRSNDENEALSPSSAAGLRGGKTLGQMTSQFEAKKEEWKKTAARKKESVTGESSFLGASEKKAEGVLLGAQVNANGLSGPRSDSGSVALNHSGAPSATMEELAETVPKAVAEEVRSVQTEDETLKVREVPPQWDSLSIEEWRQLAELEESLTED